MPPWCFINLKIAHCWRLLLILDGWHFRRLEHVNSLGAGPSLRARFTSTMRLYLRLQIHKQSDAFGTTGRLRGKINTIYCCEVSVVIYLEQCSSLKWLKVTEIESDINFKIRVMLLPNQCFRNSPRELDFGHSGNSILLWISQCYLVSSATLLWIKKKICSLKSFQFVELISCMFVLAALRVTCYAAGLGFGLATFRRS